MKQLEKIAIVSSSYPRNGVGRLTYSIAQGLAELNYEVVVVTYTKEASTKISKDNQILVNYLSCGKNMKPGLANEYIETWQAGIREAFTYRLRNTEKVLMIDSYGYAPVRQASPKAKIIGIANYLLNSYGWLTPIKDKNLETKFLSEEVDFLQGSDVLLANNVSATNKIYAKYGRQAHRLTMGIQIPQSPERHVIPGSVLFVGKLNADKGLERVVRVMAELPWMRLNVVGSGPPKGIRHLENLASKLRVLNRINFLGWLKPQQVQEYYASAEMVVVPSVNEFLGYAALDPMSLGVPLIVSTSNILPELVSDREDGWVFQNLDELRYALDEMHHQEQLRTQFAVTAKEKVERDYKLSDMIDSIKCHL